MTSLLPDDPELLSPPLPEESQEAADPASEAGSRPSAGDEQGTLFPDLEPVHTQYSTGLLPSQEIEALIRRSRIFSSSKIKPDQIQPASLDLRLGPKGYQVRASFLPGERATVLSRVKELKVREVDLTSPCELQIGRVYIVPLMEELQLPPRTSAIANPKSTTGRLDVFTRLITDFTSEFERVEEGYIGRLYAEIVPRTFSIIVRQGTRLNQLRFLRGSPLSPDSVLTELHSRDSLIYLEDELPGDPRISQGLRLAIDLSGTDGSEIIGYRGKRKAPVIDLAKIDYYDPRDFWEPVRRNKQKNLLLKPDEFYILASRERVRVPPTFAASMVPYDASIGEFRVHYAGFFDPGFGYGRDDVKGARAVLEVRTHEVPFLVEDKQVVGRLLYERLLDLPDKLYGASIGSNYQSQGLKLSKQFRSPPDSW